MRDYVAEIESKRARGRIYPQIVPARLGKILSAFKRAGDDDELLRHFPVALVAVIEDFIRCSVRDIVDGNPESLGNFLRNPPIRDQKFDLSILRAIAGKRITVGELISHMVPIKSIEGIETTMSSVLGFSFLGKIRTVHDHWAVEIVGDPVEPIIADLDRVLAVLASAVKDRNVLAHEAADDLKITPESVSDQIQATALFLDAASELIGETLYPGIPLSQGGMNRHASESADKAKNTMDSILRNLHSSLDDRSREELGRSQVAWVTYCKSQSKLEGLLCEGGSMQPMLESASREYVTESRIADLKRIVID